MGMTWTVWPLDNQMKAWLDELGVQHPNALSRFPTGSEIKATLSQLHGFHVQVLDNGVGCAWQAWIEAIPGDDRAEWTLLNVSEYSGDEEEQVLWFEKGWESLIKTILGELVKNTGPLVLIDDAGSQPQVIK